MKIIDCEQNSPEWYAARMGMPTASKFDKIITGGGEKSKQWESYAHDILAEEVLGKPIEGFSSADMEEGKRREPESVAYYEFQRNVDTTAVGFVTNDAGTVGCSPDRFVADNGVVASGGMVEYKNPKPSTYVAYLLGINGPKDYWPQLQGALYVCERQWIDFMPYYPGMPDLIIRVERDEPYIKLMDMMLQEFNAKLAKKRARLVELGHILPKQKHPGRFLAAG